MPKLCVAALLVLLVPGAACAQALGPTPEQRAACQADFDKFCSDVAPGGGRIIACLTRQYAQLSSACKKVMDANKK